MIGPQAYHKINNKIEEFLNKQQKIEETDFEAETKFNYLIKLRIIQVRYQPF